MRVIPVPCLEDNYAYLVTSDGSNDAFVIDPSEAEPVAQVITRENLRLVAIVNTHHHHDHVGGNVGLRERFGDVPVYAHESDAARVPAITDRVKEGKALTIAGVTLSPLHVPGHTTGAVAYVAEGCVFTGDTMFVGGCGRLFEGTPAMMFDSLNKKLAKLPKETRVYCGHEYTVNNLRFALQVEPSNRAVEDKLARAKSKRERGEDTMGTTIEEELATNPFLRSEQEELRRRYGSDVAIEVFAATRKEKDGFR